ncbi:DUF6367 family protein [Candidatus Latescibacterota bacterium]
MEEHSNRVCVEERLPVMGPTSGPNCPKWIVEVEFETGLDTGFCIPVRFFASTREDASLVAEALRLGFGENYSVKSLIGPELLLVGLEADRLRKLMDNEEARCVLSVYWLQVPAAAGRPPMTAGEAWQLIGEKSGADPAERPAKLEQRIPVYRVREGRRLHAEEPLILWVVEPRFRLSHILIEVREDSWAATGKLRALEEGKWMSAGIKDYMHRVEPGHPDPEVKHVHICHAKHRAARNRQVSWNEDGTRHDPMTFDVSFGGMETARQIARRVLELPDGFILEDLLDFSQMQLLEETQGDEALPPVSCAFEGLVRPKA